MIFLHFFQKMKLIGWVLFVFISVCFSVFIGFVIQSIPEEIPMFLDISSLIEHERKEFELQNSKIHPFKKFYDKASKIHGKGCFASSKINSGELIGTIIYHFKGKIYVPQDIYFVNHCQKSNTILKKHNTDHYDLYASKDIEKDEELFLNYNFAPSYVIKPTNDWKECE